MIRLKDIRPRGFPAWVGVGSENAAHRIAVQWEQDGRPRQGVYVPRRDTSSRFNAIAGGRLFPGVQHHAGFDVREDDERFRVSFQSDDGAVRVSVDASIAPYMPKDSVFESLQEASAFFEAGSLGYSATRNPRAFDGMELRTDQWKVDPLAVLIAESSFFQDESRFPPGAVEFDNALVMRGIEHEWVGRPTLCAPCEEAVAV
jgi:hypothetical protein